VLKISKSVRGGYKISSESFLIHNNNNNNNNIFYHSVTHQICITQDNIYIQL
jgi:hypothetical protein